MASVTVDMGRQVQDGWFYFRRKGSEQQTRLAAFGFAGLIKKPNDYSGSRERRGRLLALSLEPGEYELCSWALYITQLGGYGYITPKMRPQPYGFTISAGAITYIGNLHIETVLGKNVFGIGVPFGALPNISDQEAIDISVLKTKYPHLEHWPLHVTVPDGKAWREF